MNSELKIWRDVAIFLCKGALVLGALALIGGLVLGVFGSLISH